MSESAVETNDAALTRLRRERDRFAALAFAWGDILLEVAGDLTVRRCEGPAQLLLGRHREHIHGANLADLTVPDDRPLASNLLRIAGERGRIQGEWLHLVAKDGTPVPMRAAGYAYSPDTGPLYLALRKPAPAERVTADGSHRDSDTGLLDAEGFARLAASRAKDADGNAEVTLLSLPEIETLAQRLSDDDRAKLTRQLAETLQMHSVGGDTAGRVADGRYGLLRHAGTDLEQVKTALTRVTQAMDPAGQGTPVDSASIAMDEDGGLDETAITRGLMVTLNRFGNESDFRLADLSHNVDGLVDQAVSRVEGFKRVVREADFAVALQPVIAIRTGVIHHFEGLCRFNEGRPGESPFEYLRFAEETGLIHTFDMAMVRKAIAWLRSRPVNANHNSIAVNISGHSVGVQRFVDMLFKVLDDNPWTRGKLLFEITESARMSDLNTANTFIQGLRRRGYPVCLDDFGAGAASFQYLSALDVDIVKLDGSAVENARTAAQGRAFLCALVELCQRVGTETIAEKIDDAEGLQFCADCGVTYVQGFLFGKPSVRADDFTPLPNGRLLPR